MTNTLNSYVRRRNCQPGFMTVTRVNESGGIVSLRAERVKWCVVNDWLYSTVAGLFLPSEQLIVQRAYSSGGDKHCSPAMMPDGLSTLYCWQ